MANEKVSFKPDGKPNDWESGRLASEVTEHKGLLVTYHTADVRDSSGKIREDVTVTPPDKKD